MPRLAQRFRRVASTHMKDRQLNIGCLIALGLIVLRTAALILGRCYSMMQRVGN